MGSISARWLAKAIVPYLPIIFLVYFIITRIRTWYRLRHFNGPFIGKFSHAWMARTAASGRMFKMYTDVSRKYGPLARIGPNDLITNDIEIVKLMSSARSQYRRSQWYMAMRLDPYVDNLLSEMSVQVHDTRRAKMSAAYSGKENPFLEADIDYCVESFVNLIRTKYLSTNNDVKPMDFGKKAQFFTLDVITNISYGKAFGYLEQDTDLHEYIKTSDDILPYITFFASVPLANAVLNRSWIKEKFGPGPRDNYGIGRLMGVAKKITAERFGDNKIEKKDMLGAFVRNGIPQRQIESEVILQIIAGSDTTATAIRATFLHLLTHPRVLQKLRAEIDLAIHEGRISSPITNAESKSLPYVQAVVKEGLRMHPPFTGLIMKEVPPGGDTIKGMYVPGGTRIGHSTWALQRNEIYGEDGEVFRPERWIEADEERQMRMEQCLDLIFGYGRWVCLGRVVAFIELNKVFVELLRNFDFELMNPWKPWRSVNYNLFQQDEMWMRVTEREKV